MTPKYQATLKARTDLSKYKDNALLLFTLQLRFEIEDIDAVATNSLTDNPNDKKCDLVYVDKESKIAVIAQGYYCNKLALPSEAPANKASDLNTAVAWLLSTPVEQLPTQLLQSAAAELRGALKENEINSIEFWYSHNLPESINVKNELDAVTRSAQNTVRQNFPECVDINISALELGVSATEELYESLTTPILVSDKLTVSTSEGFNISASDWQAFITTIPAEWLYNLFKQHDSKLFSANIRGYLGSRNADANINNGIKQTAQSDPDHFCVFNNGITAITNKFEYDVENQVLELTGISIVNGAQTTGAIGNLLSSPSSNVRIQARFIVCTNPSTIKSVIRYNNSQNKVEAPDFRSNDSVQSRIVREFSNNTPEAIYLGGRRGGSEDVIKRRTNLLPSSTVGQALTAFHGDPLNAYNRKSDIWNSNSLYDRIFNSNTTAKHVIFVYSLHEVLDEFKRELSEKRSNKSITNAESEQLNFFLNRGSTAVAIAAISSCLEILLNQQIPNLFKLSFGYVSPTDAKLIWKEVLTAIVALISQLVPAVENGIKGQTVTTKAISTFRSLVDATKGPNSRIYEDFRSKVKID
jgi:AIPR protein